MSREQRDERGESKNKSRARRRKERKKKWEEKGQKLAFKKAGGLTLTEDEEILLKKFLAKVKDAPKRETSSSDATTESEGDSEMAKEAHKGRTEVDKEKKLLNLVEEMVKKKGKEKPKEENITGLLEKLLGKKEEIKEKAEEKLSEEEVDKELTAQSFTLDEVVPTTVGAKKFYQIFNFILAVRSWFTHAYKALFDWMEETRRKSKLFKDDPKRWTILPGEDVRRRVEVIMDGASYFHLMTAFGAKIIMCDFKYTNQPWYFALVLIDQAIADVLHPTIRDKFGTLLRAHLLSIRKNLMEYKKRNKSFVLYDGDVDEDGFALGIEQKLREIGFERHLPQIARRRATQRNRRERFGGWRDDDKGKAYEPLSAPGSPSLETLYFQSPEPKQKEKTIVVDEIMVVTVTKAMEIVTETLDGKPGKNLDQSLKTRILIKLLEYSKDVKDSEMTGNILKAIDLLASKDVKEKEAQSKDAVETTDEDVDVEKKEKEHTMDEDIDKRGVKRGRPRSRKK